MKTLYFLIAFVACSVSGFAQIVKTDLPVKLKFEARADYQYDSKDNSRSGLQGNIVDFKLEGDINERLSYKYRQRLNKPIKDGTFFDATDWLYLQFQATKNLSLMAGKWIALNGGWETEPAPIDIYQVSEFTYNYDCYQWQANLIWNSTDKNHTVYFNFCQSPYRRGWKTATGEAPQMWAYNVLWIGNIDLYHSWSSVNMQEYQPGKYMYLVALGNRVDMGTKVQLDLDLMQRVYRSGDWGKDFTVAANLKYRPVSMVDAFVKYSYDQNTSGHTEDVAVQDGTKIHSLGAGVEFWPLKNDRLRLHGEYRYSWGTNTNPDGVVKDGQSKLSVGLTWRMQVL